MEEVLLKPIDIKEILDEYVMGQEETKKILSVGIYNHFKRLTNPLMNIDKSNILMIGPTGSGKTLLAETISKILKIPFIISDATTLTEAGFIGDDVESIILKLFRSSNMDIKSTEYGIVYLDEIDKIARLDRKSIRDSSKEGVQQALLKIIEGTVVSLFPNGKNKEQVDIDTKNILFIFGGSFNGIDDIINIRLNSINGESDYNITQADLKHFGIIPEILGRIPIISTLDKPDEKMLKDILLFLKNSVLGQFEKLLKLDNVKLVVENEAIEEISKIAIKKAIGVRGLKSVMESIMLNIMYMIPSSTNIKKVILDKESILDRNKIKLEIY